MDIGSALLALSQVAVGLIGFSTVLVALSGAPGTRSALDCFRIKGMLANSICLLLLSLVPFLLSLLGVEDQLVWHCSAGLMAVCAVPVRSPESVALGVRASSMGHRQGRALPSRAAWTCPAVR